MATPEINSPQVIEFCAAHFPCARVRMVIADPPSSAIQGECFANVQQMVARKGGGSVLGWHLWELPGLLLEAEFHAVWRKPSGTLVDVTPQRPEFKEDRILFVPMPKLHLQRDPPDNIRQPLSDDPDLLRMCTLKAQIVQLMRRGNTVPGHQGAISLPRDLYEPMMLEQQEVVARLQAKYPEAFALANRTSYSVIPHLE